jgi:hypothetical protein
MKFSSSTRTKSLAILACVVAPALIIRAADSDENGAAGWYVRLDATARFNVKASLTANNPVLPAGAFADGFVLPDVGGSAAQTWNWGYQNASQIVGTDLLMHRFDTVPSAGKRDLNVDDPLLGAELIGGYWFTEFEVFRKPARFGLEVGYGYSDFSNRLNSTSAGAATYTTSTYPLNGIIPPLPPYAGTFNGPGPLLTLTPSGTTTIASAATTVFQGNLDATFQSLRFGPSVQIDLTPKISLGLGAGASSVYTSATLNYTETTTFANAGVPSINNAVNLNRSRWEPGFYFEAIGNYRFTQHVGAFAGGDYRYNNSLNFGDSAHKVEINLGSTFAAKAGVSFEF